MRQLAIDTLYDGRGNLFAISPVGRNESARTVSLCYHEDIAKCGEVGDFQKALELGRSQGMELGAITMEYTAGYRRTRG